MHERAKIIGIEGDIASLVPVDQGACAGCVDEECRKRGSVFRASNGMGYALELGMEVRVSAPARRQIAQGLLAVGVPSVAGYASWRLMERFVPGAGDSVRALVAFIAVVLGAIAVYSLSRARPKDLPEIVEIL